MYSWFRYDPQLSFSRIDFYLISDSLLSFVEHCEYLPGFKTDHSFIEIIISIDKDDRGKGLWKFNAQHLNDPEFVFKLNNVIGASKSKHRELNSDIKWEMVKCDIIGACQEYAYRKAKSNKKTITAGRKKKILCFICPEISSDSNFMW